MTCARFDSQDLAGRPYCFERYLARSALAPRGASFRSTDLIHLSKQGVARFILGGLARRIISAPAFSATHNSQSVQHILAQYFLIPNSTLPFQTRRARLRIAKSSISKRRFSLQNEGPLRGKNADFCEVAYSYEWRAERHSF